MTEKTPNYTPETEARLRAVYQPEATQDERTEQVAELAAELGKSTRSIIAKLTTMNLYVPKEYRTKKGDKVVKKEQIVAALETLVGAELSGIEKATKIALIRLYNVIAESKKADEADEAGEVSN